MNRQFMKLTPALLLLALLFAGCSKEQKEDPLLYVNPFLGTEFFGHTYPGPTLPYSLIHVGPDTHNEGWTYCAGYVYNDNNIMGFSHTHFSGVGMVAGGDVLLMPVVNQQLQVVPGSKEHPEEGYRSRFSHDTETATPGYYSVMLDDYGVKVELTTTRRVALHRYTFPQSTYSRVILDLGHQIGTMTPRRKSEFRIVDNQTIEGFRSAQMGDVYFVVKFDKPFKYYGTFDAGYKTPESGASLFPYKSGEIGDKIGAFLEYSTTEGEQIQAKVAISYVSIDGARQNMEAELNHWDFAQVLTQARQVWSDALSVATVGKDETPQNKEKFYTAIYRSLLSEYIGQDVDGQYYSMSGHVETATGKNHISSFSCWDTYRTLHPLLTLIDPTHLTDILTSIQDKIRDFGWLPAQHFQNIFGEAMVGDHLIPVVVDAYMKGYRDFDEEFVYEAMRKKATELPQPPIPAEAGRSGLNFYLMQGYTPVDKVNESVPNTLELAYDDWCIAQMARALGKTADYEYFMKRAGNYANLWDPETHFMRPRMANGKFLELLGNKKQVILASGGHSWYAYFDPLLVGRRPNRYYTESNAWQYVWSVQHDPQGLIKLFGSNEALCNKLDTFFTMDPNISGPKYVGVVGTIGQYVHGNQPSHHVAYLYNYAGQPWKTQYWARYICRNLYRTGPGGLCGNEDMGSLSSWYALSAMGIYPFTPGSPTYLIGSPSLTHTELTVVDGKKFVIKAHNNSEENVYIQSATLNGETFDRTWITQEEIMKGGVLEFKMGPKPNTNWGLTPLPLLN